jgi:iron-sulfur cluster repair protein YtfE (RIC family)
MTLTVGHRHHAELVPHVDELRLIADAVSELDGGELRERLGAVLRFIDEHLVPHMEMAEQNLYPELDRLLEDPRAMAPMRREHAAMRRLLDELRQLHGRLTGGPLSVRDELVLRRVLYRLFAMMRVHLFEEERYLAIIDRNASDPEVRSLVDGMRHAGSLSL